MADGVDTNFVMYVSTALTTSMPIDCASPPGKVGSLREPVSNGKNTCGLVELPAIERRTDGVQNVQNPAVAVKFELS